MDRFVVSARLACRVVWLPRSTWLYQYRGVSKYHFPLYLKEIEYRFNHRRENVFKQFLKIYFGSVSP